MAIIDQNDKKMVSRRRVLSLLAALGGTATISKTTFAQKIPNSEAKIPNSNSPLYTISNGRSAQFTTYNLDSGSKAPDVKPGQRKTLAEYHQPGIITRLWMTCSGWFWEHWDVRKNKYPDPEILKKLILRIYYDGNHYPSVEAPIGDFFGIGLCEYKHYTSQYLGMSSGGFYCYLPIPFKKIRIEVENLHPTRESAVFLNANYSPLNELPSDAGRLHCLYNMGTNKGNEPMTILDTSGKGHFVGCCLSMQSFLPNYLSYLEAPEFVYIDEDDKSRPTIVGTGLEDYFNGGWYFRDGEFFAPLHGVPLKDALRSMISMYRFHEADAFRFTKSFKMSFINHRPAETLQDFKFSSTAYYYLQSAQRLTLSLPAPEKLVHWYRIRDTDKQSIP